MRRIALLMVLTIALCAAAAADYAPGTDYMARMMEAVQAGDVSAGREAEARRAEKIAALGLPYAEIAYEDLALLSKIVEAEAGSSWLDLEWKMSVGEVVLNRVASPEFPDTLRAVIDQPGQFCIVNVRPSRLHSSATKPTRPSHGALRHVICGSTPGHLPPNCPWKRGGCR